MENLKCKGPFLLESGESLTDINITYSVLGKLNKAKDNVIWICHALTANSDAADWWNGLVGKGNLFDPADYFIVCPNMLGSCYGTTGPTSINPETGEKYGKDFPLITIRDMVKAHQILQKHLGLTKIKLIIGGSMGGQQAIEWAVTDPSLFDRVCLLATNAKHSPWGIAFNEAQRMAILADPTVYEDTEHAGSRGIEAARAIAMLSYRHYRTYDHTQQEETDDKIDDFRAASYQRYQGLKLQKRFEVWSYLSLSRSMDSHNIGRNRNGVVKALAKVKAKTLVISIRTDILFPVEEQAFLVQHLPNARLEVISSLYGHDGFLTESEKIKEIIQPFMTRKGFNKRKQQLGRFNGELVIDPFALPGSEDF